MKLEIQELTEAHLPMVDAFCCVESRESLSYLKSNDRRRVIKHSQEMENFLKTEALQEQNKHLNKTHLLVDIESKKIAGYISICNDNLRIEDSEKNFFQFKYYTIPALKIARLAIDNHYKNLGLGKYLISYAAYLGTLIREYSGLVFLTLDCYSHRISYYEHIGFIKNNCQQNILQYDTPTSMRMLIDDFLECQT